MKLPFFEFTIVFESLAPFIVPNPFFITFFKLSEILGSSSEIVEGVIRYYLFCFAFKISVNPISFPEKILIVIFTPALDNIVSELTLIHYIFSELQFPFSMFLSHLKLAFIYVLTNSFSSESLWKSSYKRPIVLIRF